MFKKFFYDLFFATTRGLSTPKFMTVITTRMGISGILAFAILFNKLPGFLKKIPRFMGAFTTAFLGIVWAAY